jgi:hypothetical protein
MRRTDTGRHPRSQLMAAKKKTAKKASKKKTAKKAKK